LQHLATQKELRTQQMDFCNSVPDSFATFGHSKRIKDTTDGFLLLSRLNIIQECILLEPAVVASA